MTRQRVEAEILRCFDVGFEPDAWAVAEKLADEDVAAGEYEGGTYELEMAFEEYRNEAERQLGGRS
jgi:hypothetical protein